MLDKEASAFDTGKLEYQKDWRVGNEYSDYLADQNFHFKELNEIEKAEFSKP